MAFACAAPWESWPPVLSGSGVEVRADPETGSWVVVTFGSDRTEVREATEPQGPLPPHHLEVFEIDPASPRASRRFVLASDALEGDRSICLVRVFSESEGKLALLATHRLPGRCSEERAQEDGTKLFLAVDDEEARHWLLISPASGEALGRSARPLPAGEAPVREIEVVEGRRVVVLDHPPDQTRILILDDQGATLAELFLPGSFAAARLAGSVKVFATSREATSYAGLVDLRALTAVAEGPGLVAGVPLAGVPRDLQAHRIEGVTRFVQITHDASTGRPTTHLRLFDDLGRRLAERVFLGELLRVVTLRRSKVLFLDPGATPPVVHAYFVDLGNGALLGHPVPRILQGELRSAEAAPDGERVEVRLVAAGVESSVLLGPGRP